MGARFDRRIAHRYIQSGSACPLSFSCDPFTKQFNHFREGKSMAIITISRGTFSGGKTLAECIGNQMGYPVLSREDTLIEASKTYGISEVEVSSAMADPPHFWEQVPGKRLAYVKCFTAVLLRHAENANLVYHGNAGHLLLGGISHVLRIRVIANMEFRIDAAMKLMNCNREEAIDYVEKVDKKRQKWTSFLYGVQWDDPSLYDAVLNLDRTSITSACDTISHMAGQEDSRVTPASRKAQEDLLLSSRVWIALAKDKRTEAAFVNVTADDGRVAVRGKASSGKVIDSIPLVAEHVPGVKEVATDVGVGSDWYW
jgi:cytidylate kinase